MGGRFISSPIVVFSLLWRLWLAVFIISPLLPSIATAGHHHRRVIPRHRSSSTSSHRIHNNPVRRIGDSSTGGSSCDLSKGEWVYDESYPLYDSDSCPFLRDDFACKRNGRPDKLYLKYRWQPSGNCHENISRFDGREFLRKFTGKKILFVGDSLGLSQWQSLTCMLHVAAPEAKYNLVQKPGSVYRFEFPEYELSIMMEWHQFLVDIDEEPIGRVLKLESIKGGDVWKGMDILVFDTWHWWFYKPPQQPWDYIQVGNKTLTDMNRKEALRMGMDTWARWVDSNVDPSKTSVFFQGISISHYHGADWGQPRMKDCKGITRPIQGSESPLTGTQDEVQMIKQILGGMSNPPYFLDVTLMTALRPDAHPQYYTNPGHTGGDCTHWCITGVPDAWNLMLNAVVS